MVLRNRVAVGLSALLACALATGVASGQAPSDPDVQGLEARANQFLEGVSLGSTQSAYQELAVGSLLLKQTKEVEALIKKTDQLKERYGPYREFERIAARRVGKDLVLLKYLYKCENFPVVFYFTFYRTPRTDTPTEASNTWRLIIVRFDTELELLGLAPDSKGL